MAYMQISLRSQALQRTVNVNVILPVEDLAVQGPVQPLRITKPPCGIPL